MPQRVGFTFTGFCLKSKLYVNVSVFGKKQIDTHFPLERPAPKNRDLKIMDYIP